MQSQVALRGAESAERYLGVNRDERADWAVERNVMIISLWFVN